MPRYQIFVRAKDNNIWAGIEDKPAWLHHNLNRHKRSMQRQAREINRIKRPRHPDLQKANKQRTAEEKTEHLCKHYCYKGLCPVKDCVNYMGL